MFGPALFVCFTVKIYGLKLSLGMKNNLFVTTTKFVKLSTVTTVYK